MGRGRNVPHGFNAQKLFLDYKEKNLDKNFAEEYIAE
jgi:hypothetical protein